MCQVRGLVGDAFDCSDLIARFNALRAANSDEADGGWADQWPLAPEELHAAITRRVEIEMLKLYARLRAVTEAEAEAEARKQPFDGDAFLAALPPLRDDQVPNGAPMPFTHERRFVPDPCRGDESTASSSLSSSSSCSSPKQQPVLSLARYLHSRSSLNLFNPALIYPVAPPFHSLAVAVPAPDAPSAAVAQRPWFFRDADSTRCAFPLVGRLVAGLHWRGAAPDPFANAPSLPSLSSSSAAPSKASAASAASAVLASPPVQLARAWLRRWTEWRHSLRASSSKGDSDSTSATADAKSIDRRAECGGVKGFLAAVVRAVEPLPAST